MKIYITCSVRNASPAERAALEAYTDWLEEKGHDVHLPHRDTDQEASGLEICMENGAAIAMCDEVHIFYDKTSQGSHFDLGMVFALDQLEGRKKRIRVMSYAGLGANKMTEGKSFYRMLSEWNNLQKNHENLYPMENDEEFTYQAAF
jgi:hypothetical protein